MKKFLLAILVAFLSLASAWAEVSFVASVKGGSTVEAGKRIQVEFEINDKCDNFECDPSASGLRLVSGPFPSTYMQRSIDSSGKMTTSNTTTYTYVLVAEKEGSYTIPAAKAKVGGKLYTSNELTVKAIAASQNNQSSGDKRNGGSQSSTGIGKDDIMLGIDVNKTTVYEGEALVATMKLYFRNQNVASVNDVKFPDMEGFTVQEIDLGDNVQAVTEQFNGGVYRAYPVRQWMLFPQHSGEIRIKPGSLTAIAQVYTGRRSFWDDPFNVYSNVQVPVSSAERVINVKTLPSGKPASYMNAVGEFSIKGELTSSSIKANDAVIYRITIEGTGNLKYVREPQPEFPADFEVYDPKTDLNTRVTKNGISGRKVIEYTIIPRFAGDFKIPAVEFGFFNPRTGSYQVARTDEFMLNVEKGAGDASASSGSTDYTGSTQERIKVLGSDIRYIHVIAPDSLRADSRPFFGTLAYWLWIVLPLLVLIVVFIVYRRELKLRADETGQRTRKANKVATRRLKAAAAALKAKQESAFYESVHKAMMGYVSDKLSIQLSELTTDSIRQQLASRGVDAQVIDGCADVLQTCEFARYAPSADGSAMDKLYEKAEQIIGQLEKAL
ncbi:MAG: protein BatD [Bacteroidales bacterium]|nr:protein BatD [Candidatus Liminaster caballi]